MISWGLAGGAVSACCELEVLVVICGAETGLDSADVVVGAGTVPVDAICGAGTAPADAGLGVGFVFSGAFLQAEIPRMNTINKQ